MELDYLAELDAGPAGPFHVGSACIPVSWHVMQPGCDQIDQPFAAKQLWQRTSVQEVARESSVDQS